MRADLGRGCLLALALVLAACFGTVGDVSTLKELSAAGNLEAIAAYEVTCAPTTGGCGQAHMIQADACLRRAQDTPVSGRAPYAACATEGYELALVAVAAVPDPLVDPQRLARAQLEANRAWRDAVTRNEAAPLNGALAERAAEVATTQPTRTEGPYYLADARVWPVNAGLEQPPCPAIDAATILVEATAGRTGDVDVAQLQRDLANAALANGCSVPS